MKRSIAPICAATLLLSLFVSGCESSGVQARIQEKSAVFATLTPEQKKNIEDRAIEVGYTADMVYMALGKPSKVKEKTSAEGTVSMWTYNNYIAGGSPSALSLNSPDRRGYRSGQESSSAPSNTTSLSSTKSQGPEPSVDFSLIQTETLHVFFHNGAVVQIKTEK